MLRLIAPPGQLRARLGTVRAGDSMALRSGGGASLAIEAADGRSALAVHVVG